MSARNQLNIAVIPGRTHGSAPTRENHDFRDYCLDNKCFCSALFTGFAVSRQSSAVSWITASNGSRLTTFLRLIIDFRRFGFYCLTFSGGLVFFSNLRPEKGKTSVIYLDMYYIKAIGSYNRIILRHTQLLLFELQRRYSVAAFAGIFKRLYIRKAVIACCVRY